MKAWLRRLWHRITGCVCVTLGTPEGIGGICTTCSRVHGWVSREELRAFSEREIARERLWWN